MLERYVYRHLRCPGQCSHHARYRINAHGYDRYKDQQSLKTHGSSETFTSFQKKLGKLDLMRAPMTLKMVAEKGGFSSRL